MKKFYNIVSFFTLACIFFSMMLILPTAKKVDSDIVDVNAQATSGFYWTDPNKGLMDSDFTEYDIISNTIRIQGATQLALLNYYLSNNQSRDFSGWTINLGADLDMKDHLWKPIVTGIDGFNENITFNGNGYTISNLRIAVESAEEAESGMGLFANLVHGKVSDLIIETPEIIYNYDGIEKTPIPSEPTRIAVGALAGHVDGTIIENVKVANPSIELTTKNINGHNFYVGGLVGRIGSSKLNEEDLARTIGTIDTVEVAGGYVRLKMNNDIITGGVAVNGYLGGIVGENVSGRVLNSVIGKVNYYKILEGASKNILGGEVKAIFEDNTMAGKYYLGGLVGRSRLNGIIGENIITSGVYNNIVLVDIESENLPISDPYASRDESKDSFVGIMVGEVNQNWLLNNIYLGNSLIEVVGNKKDTEGIYRVGLYITFDDGSSGSKDILYEYFGVSNIVNTPDGVWTNDERYTYDEDGGYKKTSMPFSIKNNEKYQSLDPLFLESTFYDELNNFELENDLNGISQISKLNEVYNGGEANSVESVFELRLWEKGVDGQPVFANKLSHEYEVTFDAKDGGWGTEDTERFYFKTEYYNYKNTLIAPEEPTREGHSFVGWYTDNTLSTEWVFGSEGDKLEAENITLYAKWTKEKFKLTYDYVDKVSDPIEVEFGSMIDRPENPTLENAVNYSFIGWYVLISENNALEFENVIIYENEYYRPWIFEKETMPGRDLTIFAYWENRVESLKIKYMEYRNYLDPNYYHGDTELENKPFYTEYSFNKLIEILDKAYLRIYVYDEDQALSLGLDAAAISIELDDAVSNLKINNAIIEEHVAFDSKSIINNYKFLYSSAEYQTYEDAKSSAMSYIGSMSENENDVTEIKEKYRVLDESYNMLLESNSLIVGGITQEEIDAVVNDVEKMQGEIDTGLDENNFNNSDWQRYEDALLSFESNVSTHGVSINEIKASITELRAAQAALFDEPTDPEDPTDPTDPGDGEEPGDEGPVTTKPSSLPMVLGLIGAVVIMGGVVAYIMSDMKKRKKQSSNAKFNADSDEETFI